MKFIRYIFYFLLFLNLSFNQSANALTKKKLPERFISLDSTAIGLHIAKPDNPVRTIDSDGIGVWTPGGFFMYGQKLKKKRKFLQDYMFIATGFFENTAAEGQSILAVGTSNMKYISDRTYFSFGYGLLHSYINNNTQKALSNISLFGDTNIIIPFVLFKIGYDITSNLSTHLTVIPSYATMISFGLTYNF